jgi:hypothetical protein
MSAINQYKHKLLDFFDCKSDYEIVFGNSTKNIAIYILEQDIPTEEKDFDGKKGDLIVGGGSGEAESLRISSKAIDYFKNDNLINFNDHDELVKPFWTPTFAYKLGNGLKKIGWSPNENLEFWFAEKIVNQLINNKSA